MPRYLFFILLAAGVGIGIYLRYRSTTAADTGSDTTYDTSYDDSAGVVDPNGDPSLAGVGIATQPAGSVVPVSTPYIPEGLTEIIGSLTGTISDIATAEPANAINQPPAALPITIPSTGGGPPIARPKVPAPSRGKVNTQKGNPRKGQTYRVVKNYRGKKGTWHVYGNGKAVKVK